MANKGVNIPIKGDSKSAKGALDKVTKKLNALAKTQAVSSLNRLNGAAGHSKSFAAVINSVKKAWAQAGGCAEAYKGLAKTEAAFFLLRELQAINRQLLKKPLFARPHEGMIIE